MEIIIPDHWYGPVHKLPAGRVFMTDITKQLNIKLYGSYAINNIIVSDDNYQLHLNHPALDSAKVQEKEVIKWIVKELSVNPGIARAFAFDDLNLIPLNGTIKKMLNNAYYPRRNGEIQVILQPGYIDAYSTTGTTHGLWNPYDAHIPLLWYGWGIKQGKTNRETYMTDVAPTLAAMLHIQMPNGCVGHVISEVIK